MKIDIFGTQLDDYQMEAVKAMNDAIVVVAGAGAGKTFTIQGKLKYLTEYLGYKEKEILCISFTNKSVNDLKLKINKLGLNIDVYTFHKLSLNLLKNNKYKLISDNYLDYIIDEYFKSYIINNNKYILNRLFYTNKNVNKLLNMNIYNELKYRIKYFIKLSKSNNVDIKDIFKMYKHSLFNNRILLHIVMDIMLIYKRELESTNSIDLDDLIIYATKSIKDIKLPYKYIIIDEFQDTSLIRFNLILEIIKYNKAKLMVVGDDFQSIYKFNGCKIDIFLSLNKYIKDTKYIYLKYTYRNSNELIFVSTKFIMKNKHQLNKKIISNKNTYKPIKILFNYKVEDVINRVPDLLILGRNNKDIENINYDNKLTIHKSKGLESENVLLVNSDSIPTKTRNDYLIDLILSKDEVIYAEERRLFYVALTRTKNNIYIMVNKKISPFVKELISNFKPYIEIKRK